MFAKKSLGQHWLKDKAALESICQAANLRLADTVLEVGPGLGHLTKLLIKQAGQVIAIEIDENLARDLNNIAADNLKIINGNILEFDLTSLPPDYKVVANIPYYLTSNLVRILSESPNPPISMALLVQKEVAERIAAKPGQMSLLSVSTQLYYEAKLGPEVAAELFEPPPKVNSQVIILKRHKQQLFKDLDTQTYFRLVKAGFAGRRKKLRSSLAAGLHIPKKDADNLLAEAGISGDSRAQELSLEDWHKLYKIYKNSSIKI